MTSSQRHVILVKEKNEGEAGDPYEQTFIENGFGVSFVSTVEFIYHELDILSDKLNQQSTLNGIVCTSPRGVKALIEEFSRLSENERATWQDRPLFVVGPGSAAVWLSSPYSTYLKVIAHGGNGTELARHIAGMYAAEELNLTRSLPLLVLCGNLRRPELTKSLTESSIPYSELQVYDTVQREDVVPAFSEVLDGIDHDNMKEIWLCFFSPSGAVSLNQSINQPISEYWPDKLPSNRLRIAAIGNTSAKAMKELNWQADAIADHPSPRSLFDAIESR